MPSNEDKSSPKRNWWLLGPFIALILGLNFWYDYYHPLGFVLDVGLAPVVIWRLTNKKPK